GGAGVALGQPLHHEAGDLRDGQAGLGAALGDRAMVEEPGRDADVPGRQVEAGVTQRLGQPAAHPADPVAVLEGHHQPVPDGQLEQTAGHRRQPARGADHQAAPEPTTQDRVISCVVSWRWAVPNILIRDLSQEAVDRIDAAAASLGLSRNEYLRRKFEENLSPAVERTVTAEDWQRSAEVFADLADPTVMAAAWRGRDG